MIDERYVYIVGALLAVSEALSLIPSIQANGIFQLIAQVIRGIAALGKKKGV